MSKKVFASTILNISLEEFGPLLKMFTNGSNVYMVISFIFNMIDVIVFSLSTGLVIHIKIF